VFAFLFAQSKGLNYCNVENQHIYVFANTLTESNNGMFNYHMTVF